MCYVGYPNEECMDWHTFFHQITLPLIVPPCLSPPLPRPLPRVRWNIKLNANPIQSWFPFRFSRDRDVEVRFSKIAEPSITPADKSGKQFSFQDTYCRHVNIGNQYLALHGRLCESMIILITKPLTNSTITNVTLLYGTITNSVAHQFCFITWFRQGLPTCMPVN